MDATCPHCSNSVRLGAAVIASKERLKAVQCQDCGATFDARAQMATAAYSPKPPPPSSLIKPISEKSVRDSGIMSITKKMPAFIGQYQVLDEINRGGMGIVYKAIDPELKRKVAIKVLLAGEGATEIDILRFRREAQATARLQHPNIVPIYAVGEYDGKPYFVMDFIEGRTAKELLLRGEMTPRLALKIIEGVADALHHAHINGVFHRDVKPANIIVTEDERPQLMDFGLARRVDEDLEITQSGTTMGTPAYMSPEQAEGKLDLVDGRSDVFSAGSCLYELLTGHPAFDGATTMVVLRQILDEQPVPPRKLNPAIHRDVETICLKCLEKNKASRFANALELAEDIRRFHAGEAIAAKPLGWILALWRRVRRHKEIALAALAMIVSGVCALGYAVYESRAAATAARAERHAKFTTALVEGKRLLTESRAEIEGINAAKPAGFELHVARARELIAQSEEHLRTADALYPESPEAKDALAKLHRTEIEADIRRYIFKARIFMHPPAAKAGEPTPAPNYGAAEFAAQEAFDRDPRNAEALALLREAQGIRKVFLDATAARATRSKTAASAPCDVYARRILDVLDHPISGAPDDLGERLGTLPLKNAELRPGFYIISFVVKDARPQQAPLRVMRDASDADLTLTLSVDASEQNMALIFGGETRDAAGRSVHVPNFSIDRYEYPNKPGIEPLTGVALIEARERCVREGKVLCSFAQWERACAGDGHRRFPYGNEYLSGACATGFDGNAQTHPLPSGHFPRCRTPEGVYDMAGNAAEWTDASGENLMGGDWTATLKTPELSSGCRTSVSVEDVGKDRRGFRCCK